MFTGQSRLDIVHFIIARTQTAIPVRKQDYQSQVTGLCVACYEKKEELGTLHITHYHPTPQLIYLFRSYLALAGSCFIERAENRLSRGLIDESIIYGFQENVAVLFDKLQHDLSMNIRSKSSSNSTAASSLSNFGLVRIDDILPLLDIKDRCVDWSSPLFYEDDSSELLSGNKDLTLQIILFEYAAQVFYMSIIIQKYRRDSSTAVAATSSISLASDSSSSKPNSSSQAVSSHPSDTMLVFNVEEDGFTPMLEDSVPLNAPELSSSSSFQHPAKKRRRTTALDVICSALISQDYSSSNLSENTMRVLVFFYSNSEITSNIHEICTPSVLKTLQRQLPFLQKGQLAWAFLLVTVIIRHLLPNSQLPTPHPSSSVGSCRFLSSTRAEAIFADSLVIADWWVIAERVLTSAAASYGSDHQGKSNRQVCK